MREGTNRSRNIIEKEFHEEFYKNETWSNVIKPDILFESPASFEYKFIKYFFGSIKNKVIVDLGAGTGTSSVYFALRGAQVIWIDISEEALRKARELSKEFRVEGNIDFRLGDAQEVLGKLQGLSVDLFFGAGILHHHNLQYLPQSMHSLLREGGKFAFVEPLKYNPLINIYRKMANRIRTPAEKALGFESVKKFEPFFSVSHREFWLTSAIIFLKFYLINRVYPNDEPYWKRIFYDNGKGSKIILSLARHLDNLLIKIRPLNYLCWQTVIYGEKR